MANLSNINNKFLVTTGGNVLIGQTAAVGTSILQVTGNSIFTGSVRVSNPTQSNYWLYNATKTNGFLLGRSIGSNDAQDFFIFDTISNSARLQINSVGDITFSNQATFGGDITIYEPAGNAAIILSGGAANNETYQIAQGVTGISNGGFSIRNMAETKDVMVFQDVTGNVGIGTSSPGAKLEIAGTTEQRYLQVDAIAGFAGLGSGMAAMVEFDNAGDGNNVTIKTNNSVRTDAAPFSVWTETNSRFIVRNNGTVGIGTTSPSEKLEIQDGNVKIEQTDRKSVV